MKLSVIVTGPDVQGHLRECLDSVAGQSGAESELLVVPADEAARTECDGYAARVLPVEPSAPAARHAGAAAASGEWLLFLDSKDLLLPEAVRTLVEHADTPADVLLFDHVRAYWWDPARPSTDTKLLAAAGHEARGLSAAPTLLDVTPLLGNRALRAAFYRDRLDSGLLDDPAPAGELATAYASLLLADRIACLDTALLAERRLRRASLPPLTAEQHYALFDEYEEIWALAENAPASVRGVLYDRMTADYLRIIARPGLLPEELAPEFFRRACEHAVRFRPEGHAAPDGLAGVRQNLLVKGQFAAYRTLQKANRKQRDLTATLQKRKRKLGASVRRRRYEKARSRPVDRELAVFSAYWDRGVACNPGAIAAKLAELAPEIHPVWVVGADKVPLLPPGTDHVVPGSKPYLDVLGRAGFLVNNVNFPNMLVKRPEQTYIQTHHGTPLKRMGLDQMDFPAASKGLNFRALLARVDRWDYSLSANSHSTRMWAHAYPSHYTPLDYGYPRNDVFHRATAADVRAVRAKLGIAPGKRALLYAPTHRDYEAGWTPRLDLAALAESLGEDTVLLVRGHYFYGGSASPLARLRGTGRVIDVSAYDPVEDVCLAADALIADYSSIQFDYANLDRPIVIYADDWEMYSRTRGVYFDLLAEPPGQVARTQDELTEILRGDAWRDSGSAKLRSAFRQRFCEFDDGAAAERVVRRVFLGERPEALPKIIPVEDRTPAPTPEEAA
ncbi:CDP-glycerol glycerophosphotransferase family protein [Streptomyces sp. N35]|uniref:bifunctional glycosyltransferase/CDP-glycerol:glycerophosphate glycerophosphotransferase n=1 Tax=Streptomyces sp. N35 TaxID=2795730 RepID=UPI0018F42707|nr:CDP-glycerol glycerophosphotransferase family protein [Streptomyces sp. N35]